MAGERLGKAPAGTIVGCFSGDAPVCVLLRDGLSLRGCQETLADTETAPPRLYAQLLGVTWTLPIAHNFCVLFNIINQLDLYNVYFLIYLIII